MYASKIPYFDWTSRDHVCSPGEEGVTHDSLDDRALPRALASDDDDLREPVLVELARHVLKIPETLGQNAERLAHC